MAQIVIPEVGESITSGVLAAWLKPDGQYVQRDEPVLELETDKITQELVAPAAGLLKHRAAAGDEVQIGAIVGEIDESAAKPGAAPASTTAPAKAESARQTQTQTQAPAPAATTTAARAPGVRAHERASSAAPTSAAVSGGANGRATTTADDAPDADGVRASPTVRRLAAEHGIRLADVRAADGRVRERDIMDAVNARQAAPAAPAPAPSPPGAAPAPQPAGQRTVRRERMTPLRQRIATRLVEAQHTAAMLTTFNECDMTAVMALRSRYKETFEKKHGVGLGFMSFFVKASVLALQSHPSVNAFIVQGEGGGGGPAIEYHDYADIAIAVSTPKGLVVPVLRDCQSLSFAAIERGIKDLADRAKDAKLSLEEMQGGTFTITNGGVFGSLLSTPILNPPQSAILGMHTIKKRAVEDPDKPGQLALRPMMYLALSYDHRIIDGAQAVRFLVTIKEAIENPERLLLDL